MSWFPLNRNVMVVVVVLGGGAGGKGGHIVNLWITPVDALGLAPQHRLVRRALVGVRPLRAVDWTREPSQTRRGHDHQWPTYRYLRNRAKGQVAALGPQVRRPIQALFDQDRVARSQAHRLLGPQLEEPVLAAQREVDIGRS